MTEPEQSSDYIEVYCKDKNCNAKYKMSKKEFEKSGICTKCKNPDKTLAVSKLNFPNKEPRNIIKEAFLDEEKSPITPQPKESIQGPMDYKKEITEIYQRIKDLPMFRNKVGKLENELTNQAKYNNNKITEEIKKLGDEKYKEINRWVKNLSTAPIRKGLIGGLVGGLIIGAGAYYLANKTIIDKTEDYETGIQSNEDNLKDANQRIKNLESRVNGNAVQAEKITTPVMPNINNTLNIPKENVEYKITISAVSADGRKLQSNCTQTYGQIVKWYDMDNMDEAEFSSLQWLSVITQNILKNTSLLEKVKLLGGDTQMEYDKDVINAYFNDDKKDGYITNIQIKKK